MPSNHCLAKDKSRLSWLEDLSFSQKDYVFRYDLLQCVSQHKYDLHDYYFLTTVAKIPTVRLTSNFGFMKFIDVLMLLQSDVW